MSSLEITMQAKQIYIVKYNCRYRKPDPLLYEKVYKIGH